MNSLQVEETNAAISVKTPRKPQRVGFLLQYGYSGRGGTEQALINLVQGLQAQGVEVSIFYFQPFDNNDFLKLLPNPINLQDCIQSNKSRYKLLPPFLRKFFKQRYIRNITKKVIESQILPKKLDTLIILDLPYRNLDMERVILDYKAKSNTRIYSWLHALTRDLSEDDRLQFGRILKLYDGHLAVSQGILEEFIHFFKIGNVRLVYNPVLPAAVVSRDIRKLLYVGRIVPIKQVPQLMQMLTKLEGDWMLDIYGTTGTEDGDAEFLQFIKTLKMEERVTFHGWSNTPWDHIESAGILLLNSYQESFGMVLVEAMMRGIPCISSNCPVGPREIIQEGINGWLYPLEDEEAFSTLLNKISEGIIAMPSPEEVQSSVAQFDVKKVVQQFLKATSY